MTDMEKLTQGIRQVWEIIGGEILALNPSRGLSTTDMCEVCMDYMYIHAPAAYAVWEKGNVTFDQLVASLPDVMWE